MTPILTRHAEARAATRGIGPALISAILENFDIDHTVGRGCRVLRLSEMAAEDAAQGSPGLAARLQRIALVENEATGAIVTALVMKSGKAARHYRRCH